MLAFAPATLHALYALDSLFHLDKTLRAGFTTDFNRTLGPSLDAFIGYKIVWLNRFTFAIGGSLDVAQFKASGFYWELGYLSPSFLEGDMAFEVRVKFLSTIYPQYLKSFNSIVPYAVFHYRFLEAEFGVDFRFLNAGADSFNKVMYYPSGSGETQFYWALRASIETFRGDGSVTFEAANFDDFTAGNTGTIRLFVRSVFPLKSSFYSLCVDAGFQPAGSIALTANFHHFYLIVGGRFRL